MAHEIQGDRNYILVPEGPLYHAKRRKRGLDLKGVALAAAFAAGLSIPFGLAAYNGRVDQGQPPLTPTVEPENSSTQRIKSNESIPLGLIASQFLPENELGKKIDDLFHRRGVMTRLYACFPDNGGPVTGTVLDDLPLRNLPTTEDPAAGVLPRGTKVSYNLVVRTTLDPKIATPNGLPLNDWAVVSPDAVRSAGVPADNSAPAFAAIFYGAPKIAEDGFKTCAPVVTEPIQPK